jgi:hypothetical protein
VRVRAPLDRRPDESCSPPHSLPLLKGGRSLLNNKKWSLWKNVEKYKAVWALNTRSSGWGIAVAQNYLLISLHQVYNFWHLCRLWSCVSKSPACSIIVSNCFFFKDPSETHNVFRYWYGCGSDPRIRTTGLRIRILPTKDKLFSLNNFAHYRFLP